MPRTPAHNGPDDQAIAAIERVVLGGDATLTRRQVAEKAGVDPAFAEQLWTAMGFPATDDDSAVFGRADIEALRVLSRLRDETGLDPAQAVALARTNSQHLAAIADAEAAFSAARWGHDPAGALAVGLPAAERLLVYVWRRQLLAAAIRTLGSDGGTGLHRRQAVGFADLVGFTSLTRGMEQDDLLDLVVRFDAQARERVATRGGRVIKTIGDEVLFTAGSVQEGAEIAFALLEIGDQDDLPPLRVGLAYGEVVLRHGDVFGEVVNIASRLVSLARPSSVLVDREAAALLDGQDGWELRRLRPQRVRGYEHLVATVLRRAG